ncbi:hypothetical protein C8T65DRAFT_275091 [Cerioporus squamosus]|nr:hypothetical protein C8T65DRAFT_275091 [Cerioporus squamosus]
MPRKYFRCMQAASGHKDAVKHATAVSSFPAPSSRTTSVDREPTHGESRVTSKMGLWVTVTLT